MVTSHDAPPDGIHVERLVSIADFEGVARERLPKDVVDFVEGGAGDEWTLRENTRAFERWTLRPRVLRGVSERDMTTQVLGTALSMPVMVAPWAYQRMVHPDGELATARAAARSGTVMVVATPAERDLEAIAAASSGPRWWQLYVFADRGFTADMLHRVAAAGYGAVVFTVDLPVVGTRNRDDRNGFEIPVPLRPSGGPYDPAIGWGDLAWIREHAPLPILVKGILTAEDARLAVDAAADGIVVSNHGGRQLDGVQASVEALPEVVEAVAGRIPVLLDGGVRRGSDVLKSLALGAAAVLIGRPTAWGLAVDGEDGVVRVLEILREELDTAMALAGCRTISDVTPELVARG
jgi:isopentenyl diphosphate isomerase/L-lactate dehydrogenase-like FMN-dependent dehydrogenase